MAGSSPTTAALLRRIEALERALDPQTVRNSLERTFDPRGGEPRVVSPAGRTLDYAPAIQFTGALTTTLDSSKQRVVVNAPDPTKVFSPDGTVGATEMLEFRRPADNVLQAALKTLTYTASPAVRELHLVNAENGVTTSDPASNNQTGPTSYLRLRTWSGGNEANLRASGGSSDGNVTGLDMVSDDGLNTNTATLQAVRDEAGTCTMVMRCAPPGGAEARITGVVLSTSGAASISMSMNTGGGSSWVAMNSDRQSHYMQLGGPAASGGANHAGRRVVRGPFKVAVPALAAGAVHTVAMETVLLTPPENTITGVEARYGPDYLVFGAVKAAAGTVLVWSYADGPGAAEATVSVVNNAAAASAAATLYLYTLCLQ